MTALPAVGASAMPSARPISGENVIRMPMTYQIGTPIRMTATYFLARSQVLNSCSTLPRLEPICFTFSNMPDSYTPIRSASSAKPMMPPTM